MTERCAITLTINGTDHKVTDLLKRVDMLLVNDAEARQLIAIYGEGELACPQGEVARDVGDRLDLLHLVEEQFDSIKALGAHFERHGGLPARTPRRSTRNTTRATRQRHA